MSQVSEAEIEALADTLVRAHSGVAVDVTIRSQHRKPKPIPWDGPEIDLGPVLGEGGMGVVRLAVQTPLARDVAVKSLKKNADPEAELSLVEEALVTGALEHPNIIPIHSLDRDDSGSPLLVMKRIEGVSWRKLIQDPNHPGWESVRGDRQIFHLEILMQISNAVHFAHSKRIVHRDLKPENVMIGRFGEVYVLDWGIALRLDQREPAPPNTVVGTIGYMAPEMANGEIERIDERTDVYLLGAMLHEVLTGSVRHSGPIGRALLSAFRSEPFTYDSSVPKALANIANQAMSRDPADRHPTAEAFKQAIADFLRQRSSILLSDQAAERFRALGALLDGDEAADPVTVYKLFGECRFGFEQALRTASENAEAAAGLEGCMQRMVEYELRRRNPKAAAVLLAELASPPPELVARVEALTREVENQEAELLKLRQIERDLDVDVAIRTRAILAIAVGLGFNLAVLGWLMLRGAASITVEHTIVIAALFFASVLGVAAIARRAIAKNSATRRLVIALGVAAAAMLLHRLSALQVGTPVESIFVADLVVLATSGGTVAATLDRRFVWVSIYLAAVVFVAGAWPSLLVYTFPAAATLGAAVLGLSWRGDGPSA